MAVPEGLTVITPTQIQASNTTTPNGVATSLIVLGDDGNLYYRQISVPGMNAAQLAQQPWMCLPPITYNTATNPDTSYPYPTITGGNVQYVPYDTFKRQGE